MTDTTPPWLDDVEPHEPDVSERQIKAVRAHCAALGSARILDLGAGAGRLAAPLCADGHQVMAVDHSEEALAQCIDACADGALTTITADFQRDWPDTVRKTGPFDVVLCLGNTFMLLHDLDDAIVFLTRCRDVLADDGIMLIDDLPREFWPELAEGLWQAGVSEDGELQLVWEADDAVFTLRMGDRVNENEWAIGADEPRYRLWTRGLLDAVARCAGLSVRIREKSDGLFELRGPGFAGNEGQRQE